MSEVEFSSDITVKTIRHMASDDYVVQAAQVSSKGENKPGTDPERLVNVLLRERHGTPFEHSYFTFFVEAPIFVFRQWHKHRISTVNEMSGRYTTLPPKFYIPDNDRKMINYGTKMKPKFSFDRNGAGDRFRGSLMDHCRHAYELYLLDMEDGIAEEMARIQLPLSIYSQMYWTVNARSLMNFLSLRVESEDSTYKSHPQYEIELGARLIEDEFARIMPFTHKSFVKNGRVAP